MRPIGLAHRMGGLLEYEDCSLGDYRVSHGGDLLGVGCWVTCSLCLISRGSFDIRDPFPMDADNLGVCMEKLAASQRNIDSLENVNMSLEDEIGKLRGELDECLAEDPKL